MPSQTLLKPADTETVAIVRRSKDKRNEEELTYTLRVYRNNLDNCSPLFASHLDGHPKTDVGRSNGIAKRRNAR